MKITAKAIDLSTVLDWAGKTIGEKKDMPDSWMYLNTRGEAEKQELRVYSTDMTNRTLASIPVTVDKHGDVFIHHNILANFIATIPKEDDVELWTTGATGKEVLNLRCPAGRCSVPVRNTDGEIKALESVPTEGLPLFEIKASTLLELINRIKFATTLKRNIILSAIHIFSCEGGYRGQATDANIAANAYVKDEHSKNQTGHEITIPCGGLDPLIQLLTKHNEEIVSVVPGREKPNQSNNMYFKFSNAMYGTVLLVDKYPNLEQIMQAADKLRAGSFRVESSQLKLAVNRAMVFSEHGHIQLIMKDNSIKLSVDGGNIGRFETTMNGADDTQKMNNTISLNLNYLSSILKDVRSNNITIVNTIDNSRVWINDTEDLDKNVIYLLGCVRV